MSRIEWIIVIAAVLVMLGISFEVWRVDRELTRRQAQREAMLKRLREQQEHSEQKRRRLHVVQSA